MLQPSEGLKVFLRVYQRAELATPGTRIGNSRRQYCQEHFSARPCRHWRLLLASQSSLLAPRKKKHLGPLRSLRDCRSDRSYSQEQHQKTLTDPSRTTRVLSLSLELSSFFLSTFSPLLVSSKFSGGISVWWCSSLQTSACPGSSCRPHSPPWGSPDTLRTHDVVSSSSSTRSVHCRSSPLVWCPPHGCPLCSCRALPSCPSETLSWPACPSCPTRTWVCWPSVSGPRLSPSCCQAPPAPASWWRQSSPPSCKSSSW